MKIFWKIFLGFWLTSFLMIISSILIGHWFLDNAAEPIKPHHSILLNDLAQLVKEQGPDGIQRRIKEGSLPPHLHITLIANDKLLFPDQIRWWDWQLADQLNEKDNELRKHNPGELVLGRYIQSNQNTTFKLLLHSPHPFKRGLAGWRILAALLMSGLICYLLARYITSPIKYVSIAARKLSEGNLSARVSLPHSGRNNKNSTDEISQLALDFNIMADQLEQQIEGQQLLLRDVSHELRSPLARLQVAVELARQRSDGGAENEFNRINKEVEEFDKLISQLLELPRMSSGTIALEESIDISSLVKFIIDDCQFEANADNKYITFHCNNASHYLVQGSGEILKSAIENIIRNAIRHTPPEGKIEVTTSLDKNQLLVSIRDYGEGVPDFELDKIFQPFYRVSRARERRSGGTGIGLAIAYRAIKLHNGSIEARAAQPGLEIRITLPTMALGHL